MTKLFSMITVCTLQLLFCYSSLHWHHQPVEEKKRGEQWRQTILNESICDSLGRTANDKPLSPSVPTGDWTRLSWPNGCQKGIQMINDYPAAPDGWVCVSQGREAWHDWSVLKYLNAFHSLKCKLKVLPSEVHETLATRICVQGQVKLPVVNIFLFLMARPPMSFTLIAVFKIYIFTHRNFCLHMLALQNHIPDEGIFPPI